MQDNQKIDRRILLPFYNEMNGGHVELRCRFNAMICCLLKTQNISSTYFNHKEGEE